MRGRKITLGALMRRFNLPVGRGRRQRSSAARWPLCSRTIKRAELAAADCRQLNWISPYRSHLLAGERAAHIGRPDGRLLQNGAARVRLRAFVFDLKIARSIRARQRRPSAARRRTLMSAPRYR